MKTAHFRSTSASRKRTCLSSFGGFIRWKKSADDELSSNTSSSCDVESLQLAEEGERSFNSIVQR